MNKAALLLLLTTVIASIACMHLVRELREERERGALLQDRVEELERVERERSMSAAAVFSVMQIQPAPAEALVRSITPARAPTAAQPVAVPAAPFDHSEQLRRHFERQRDMLRDPEYREAMRAQHRFGFMASYPNLASELGLSQDEADRFLDLLAEQQVRAMENSETTVFREASPDEAALREGRELALQRHQQNQNEIESLLGPSRYQQWTEYQETLGQRHRLASLQSSLAMAGAPLNEPQSATLLSALVDEQRREQALAPAATPPLPEQGAAAALEAWIDLREQEQERLLGSLGYALTEQQISHLKDVFTREIEMQRVQLKMQRAQPDGAAGNVVFSTGHYGAPSLSLPLVAVESTDDRAPAPD